MNTIKFLTIAAGVTCTALFSNCKKEADPTSANISSVSPEKNAANISSVLFNGDASRGSSNVWYSINIEGSGYVNTVTDETGTLVWKFYKPSGSHRSEGHGVKGYRASEGSDIYIGWTSKLLIPSTLKTDAVFQWKSYPTEGSNANHPVMLRTKDGRLELQYFDQTHTAFVPWSTTLSPSTWMKVVLRIKVSRSSSVGFIELWYNGVKQTFSNGSQRYYAVTLDSDYCDPKWGVYGGDASTVTNYVKKIRVATTYSEAAQ
jgi:hypothetical protein